MSKIAPSQTAITERSASNSSLQRKGWAFFFLLATIVIVIAASLVYLGRAEAPSLATVAQAGRADAGKEPITPLPLTTILDASKVALGRRLFHEVRLSGDGTVSCAHCHNLGHGGADGLTHSRGVGGQEGEINSPTVFNSGFSFRQFWDGRVQSLEEQIDGPLTNPVELGSSWPRAIAALSQDPSYRDGFEAIYHDGIQVGNIKDAIATFERSLVTPNSRFDRYLRGEPAALSQQERDGYRLFKAMGCASCHQGINIGGNLYQKLGVMEDYFSGRGHVTPADLGRLRITRREEDRHVFKVPSLRNVALTAPYLHDGSAKTLEEAVRIMARYQLGERLDADETAQLVAFLRTLSGEYQGKPLE